MDVQDLINQQAVRNNHPQDSNVNLGDSLGNIEGDKGIDPLYNLLHKQGKVSISNGVIIESF